MDIFNSSFCPNKTHSVKYSVSEKWAETVRNIKRFMPTFSCWEKANLSVAFFLSNVFKISSMKCSWNLYSGAFLYLFLPPFSFPCGHRNTSVHEFMVSIYKASQWIEREKKTHTQQMDNLSFCHFASHVFNDFILPLFFPKKSNGFYNPEKSVMLCMKMVLR